MARRKGRAAGAQDRKKSQLTSSASPVCLQEHLIASVFEDIIETLAGDAEQPHSSYVASPIKRRRRTKADIETLKNKLYSVVNTDKPMTVRQVFYRLVSLGAIDKTEQEYNGAVVRLLSQMRRAGEIPFSWIADNTRFMRKPRSYGSLEDALTETAAFYRRRLWDDQPAYVEVWLEKDALSGVLYPITAKYDVPLMPTRGYPSLTFLHTAAEVISEQKKPAFLYYLGDHDPSGVHIPQKIEQDLRAMAPKAEIHFERIAVNLDQIARWNLPTRPTKKTDSRAKNFRGESVEVDAIAPADLRSLVEAAIVQHIDQRALETTLAAEQSEREVLETWPGW